MRRRIIHLIDISAGYGQEHVLEDVNLEVFENDFIGIIGPNGGGKTTLLKVILGLLTPSAGNILRDDSIVSRSGIGYLPQYSSIDKRFPITIKDVVASGITRNNNIFRLVNKSHRNLINSCLHRLDLYKIKDKAIGEVSGGQMQRALIARAIIDEPELLILDEPDTYVDNNFEKELYELLHELNNKMAIMMVSHDMGMISSYVKTIACVNKTLDYHHTSKINETVLKNYNCPIDLIAHGKVPHRVLNDHT